MTGIDKAFSGQRVLHAVDFDLRPGEVHLLAGENGAGKSTLIKILAGVLQPDSGTIQIRGRESRFRSVAEARRAGVSVIHQELSLAPAMSIADNLFLGREQISPLRYVHARRQIAQARTMLSRVGLDIDPRRTVNSLPVAPRQLIEIAKALSNESRIIVMDEPTSALPTTDAARLFSLIADLKAQNTGIIYITHRMEEIDRLADRITVLRDGKRILTSPAKDLDRSQLIQAMVGRTLDEQIQRTPTATSDELLKVDRLSAGRRQRIHNISFSLNAGQVLGVAGLQGSGASTLLHTLFGDQPIHSGSINIQGKAANITNPRTAINRNIALVTADRKTTGLCLGLNIRQNATLAALPKLSPAGLLRHARESAAATDSIKSLNIRCRSPRQPVNTLSGGNQQKVALAKWAMTNPQILLLDEPTRGVDIGAKQEIYGLINQWTAQGAAVILVTSELSELLGLADRLIVLHRGRITARLNRDQATPQRVIAAAMGSPEEAAA